MRLAAAFFTLFLLAHCSEALGAPPIDSFRGRPRDRARAAALRAEARARGVDQPLTALTARAATAPRAAAVVILVQFTDMAADTLNHTPADYQSLLFSMGTHPTGSMRDYYNEVSRGQFDVDGVVTRWYTAPQTYAFYADGQAGVGGGFQSAQGLAEDAVRLADDDVDFSLYDNDGPDGIPRGLGSTDDDGVLDALFIVHAGPGNEETGDPNDIVSHFFHLLGSGIIVDGVLAFGYTTEPERWAGVAPFTNPGDLASVGVFCHEFGHVLGLPDLYDLTDTPAASEGVGDWDVMATGVYTHLAGKPLASSPAHFSAWSKVHLGWVEPTFVLQDSLSVAIPPVETSGRVFRLWKDGLEDAEYFLVENRQPIGFDGGLVRSSIEGGDGAASGLMIYHVNEAVGGNDDPDSKMLDVEEAGGVEQLFGYPGTQNLDLASGDFAGRVLCGGDLVSVQGNRGDLWDPWPGLGGAVSFDAGSCPGSGSACGNAPSQVAIRNIAEVGVDIGADFYVSGVRIHRDALSVDDTPFEGHPNNGNGRAETGETIRLRLVLENQGLAPTGPLLGTVSAGPYLTLLNDSLFHASIAPGAADSGSVVYAAVLSAPDPRGVLLRYAIRGNPGLVDTDSVQVLVGTDSGICETFEGTSRQWLGVGDGCAGVNQWHREAGVNHTPGGAWAYRLGPVGLVGSYIGSQDARLVSQPIALSGTADTLRFWQRYDTDFSDGLSVEITTDGGQSWTLLNPAGGYPNIDRWSGVQTTFALARVPLTGYTGQVQIGFRFRASPPTEGLGWWIDDVTIAGTDVCGTTAVAISRFDATPEAGRVRLTWHVADELGATVRIDRQNAPGGARVELATVPTDAEGAYEDASVTPGVLYRYWITLSRPGEPEAEAGPVEVVAASASIPPRVMSLSRVRPNPFVGSAAFTVSLDREGPFVLRVYRADGSLVRTLADTRGRAESYPFTWDGTDGRGKTVGAGLYFIELRSAHAVRVQKAILLR